MPAPIECVAFRPGWEDALARFFSDLNAKGGGDAFFHPHASDEAGLHGVARDIGDDLYYLFVRGREVLGYGLLRGWNEGYEIPSLGIAVHPSMRGTGLGRSIMDFLEAMARMRGASSIRLRVHKDNAIARGMYARRGYRLTPDGRDESLIVGIKSLRGDAG
jgi:ribosomal protein S18 acetylase RimI-like enzyme